MKTEAIVFEDVNRVGIRSLDLPAIAENEILLESIYSTVSPGTELRTLAGKEQTADPFPLVPGYSTVGKIAQVGSKTRGLEVGTLAYVRGCRSLGSGIGCSWGGHARHLIAPQEEVFVLPESVSLREATLTALLATALHGVDLAGVRIREQVAVIGLGLMGQLCARLLKYAGAHVVATDLVPLRREVAQAAGVTTVEAVPDLKRAFDPYFPFGAEAVLDATGSSRAMKGSLQLLREKPRKDPCGATVSSSDTGVSITKLLRKQAHLENEWRGPRLIAQGSYAEPMEINYYDVFCQEVKLIVPRVHELKDIYRAVELFSVPDFSLNGLITQTLPYSSAPSAYQQLRERPGDQITVTFAWNA